jgi:hypothetical protein
MAPLVEAEALEDLGSVAAQGDRLPVLGQHPVPGGVEGGDGTHHRRFLAVDGGVGAAPALALEGEEPVAGRPGLDHLVQHGHDLGVGERRRGADRPGAVLGEHPVELAGGAQLVERRSGCRGFVGDGAQVHGHGAHLVVAGGAS